MTIFEQVTTRMKRTTSPVDEMEKSRQPAIVTALEIRGVAGIEAAKAVWGKTGLQLVWIGIVLMMIIFELDNSTVYNYMTFATSSFGKLSLLATLQTCQTIVTAVVKVTVPPYKPHAGQITCPQPPIAKVSDVIGRGETYIFTIACYIISYIMCAKSTSINVYAGGVIFYAIGQSGTQVLNQIIIGDISSTKWRGFAISISFLPFLITPWVSAFIVDSVVAGIGWRWGIAMFAILMPVCASPIFVTLIYYGRKAKNAGVLLKTKTTVYEFCSLIDLGGVILLTGGFAMVLLPISLSATTPSKWTTAWVDAVIAVGVVFLITLVPYEKFIARHPVLPTRYFRNLTVVSSCLLGFFDVMGFAVTHTYLYPWVIVAHGYSVRDATFLVYINGVSQALFGIVAGYIMAKTLRYKWVVWIGCVVRAVGYGVMVRLRGQDNSMAELFIVQTIQGVGSGFIQMIIVVCAQIVVPHAELAQVSALVLLFSFLGSAVGSAIGGGIYTNAFPQRLHKLLPGASDEAIQKLVNSVTDVLPDQGTSERNAINFAYSDIMRYTTFVALGVSLPMFLFAWIMPSKRLNNTQNLVETDRVEMAQTDNASAHSSKDRDSDAKV